jgi:hypothetical protein
MNDELEQATPAEAARAYAAKHGFTITPVGRRYQVACDLTTITEVGSYTAALNTMKRHVEMRAVGADRSTPPYKVTFNPASETPVVVSVGINTSGETSLMVAQRVREALERHPDESDASLIERRRAQMEATLKRISRGTFGKLSGRAADMHRPYGLRTEFKDGSVRLLMYRTRGDAVQALRRLFNDPLLTIRAYYRAARNTIVYMP